MTLPGKLGLIQKALAAFLIPVVPAVTAAVVNGWTWGSTIIVALAVLAGLGVYAIPNAKSTVVDGS